ncbi:MAG TPA: hypothetical protein VE985_01040 [Gaiellaceae bacterium]|nr:hypothetical protein [Gaiellaceae bacterium]
MSIRITPDPDEAELQAIVEAIAAEDREQPAVSAWAAAALPSREEDEP